MAVAPAAITTFNPAQERSRELQTPFVAAAQCEALCSARLDADEVADYLRSARESEGSWRFEPANRGLPPDADTTSCVVAALVRTGHSESPDLLRRILEEQPAPDGLIRPWLHWYPESAERLDGNVPDAIVTANVLLAATRLGLDASHVERALVEHVGTRGLSGVATLYYDSLAVRTYYLARATEIGAIARLVREFLLGVESRHLSIVDAAAALAAAALLGVDVVIDDLRHRVLALRADDGTWPAAKWFVDPADCVWSSAAFSTALAEEALALAELGAPH